MFLVAQFGNDNSMGLYFWCYELETVTLLTFDLLGSVGLHGPLLMHEIFLGAQGFPANPVAQKLLLITSYSQTTMYTKNTSS